jgi:hypothetical protein
MRLSEGCVTQGECPGCEGGLPGIDIDRSANPAHHRYFRDQVEHEHSGAEGLKLAAVLAAGPLGILNFFAWPLVRHRRPKSVDAT